MVNTTTITREQIARPVIDLIEQFGFGWEMDGEYPLPDMGQRLQIRTERNYAPAAKVGEIRAALKRGVRLPPIVVTKDGHLIDGSTRVTAALRNGMPYISAIVLTSNYQGASEDEYQRMTALGAGFNARNGKGINREELRRAVSDIGNDPLYSATRIAALIGVTEQVVRTLLAEKKGRDRAELVGLYPNGSIKAAQLGALGRQSDHLNDEPFKALFTLVEDTGMGVAEVKDLAKRTIEPKSDEGAMEVLLKEREARSPQIAQYKASGKSVPPASAKLRQRLGFLLHFEATPVGLKEHNPQLSQEYVATLERSIKVLQAIIDTQG